MRSGKMMILAGAAAIAVPVFIAWRNWSRSANGAESRNGSNPNIKNMVENIVAEHKGEASSFVHAFEEALDTEMQHEHGLLRPSKALA